MSGVDNSIKNLEKEDLRIPDHFDRLDYNESGEEWVVKNLKKYIRGLF